MCPAEQGTIAMLLCGKNVLLQACGKLDKQIVIVGLVTFKCGLVANGLTAFFTAVNDDKSLFGVGQSLYGTKNSLTGVRSVAGIYINVKRAEAEGTVISRCVAEGLNLSATVLTNKACIVLFKSLVFHNTTYQYLILNLQF